MISFDLSLPSSRSSYFANFRHQLTFLTIPRAPDATLFPYTTLFRSVWREHSEHRVVVREDVDVRWSWQDRKSTRLNSSHVAISYAGFCLKKNTTCRVLSLP